MRANDEQKFGQVDSESPRKTRYNLRRGRELYPVARVQADRFGGCLALAKMRLCPQLTEVSKALEGAGMALGELSKLCEAVANGHNTEATLEEVERESFNSG